MKNTQKVQDTQAPTAAVNAVVGAVNPETVQSLPSAVAVGVDVVSIGKLAGRSIASHIGRAQASACEVLMLAAHAYRATPQATDWLKGYGDGYAEVQGDDVAKVRKSEAKAVIEAYAINADALEAYVKEPAKNAYSGLITLARTIRPTASRAASKKAPKVTDKQQGEILEKVTHGMTFAQVLGTVEAAGLNMARMPEPEIPMLSGVAEMLAKLGAVTKSEPCKQFCADTLAAVDAFIRRIEGEKKGDAIKGVPEFKAEEKQETETAPALPVAATA